MDKATESYTLREAEVTDLLQKLNTAHENAQYRANNEISAEQRKIIVDEDANMVAWLAFSLAGKPKTL